MWLNDLISINFYIIPQCLFESVPCREIWKDTCKTPLVIFHRTDWGGCTWWEWQTTIRVDSTANFNNTYLILFLLLRWVRLSAILKSRSFSSSVACGPSSLDSVMLRSPGTEPTRSSAVESCTTTDTSPLLQADLLGGQRDNYSNATDMVPNSHIWSSV